jgi:hypothetical protein
MRGKTMRSKTTSVFLLMSVAISFGQYAHAADDLAAAATNPVSNLIQFRLQDQYTSSTYNASGYANSVMVQGVVPLPDLASKFDSLKGIVTRTTAAYVATPDFDGIGRQKGVGDTSILAFAVPKASPEKTVWGVGPALTVPTAGDNEFTGQGQWQAGPAAVVMVSPVKNIQVGALVFHQWDFASSRSNTSDVNQTFIQPIFNYHFEGGWYVGLPDTPQNYNHETNEWTLNLGGVLGRVTKVDGQPMQLFAGVYYNPNDPDGLALPEVTFMFQVGWLFPG